MVTAVLTMKMMMSEKDCDDDYGGCSDDDFDADDDDDEDKNDCDDDGDVDDDGGVYGDHEDCVNKNILQILTVGKNLPKLSSYISRERL